MLKQTAKSCELCQRNAWLSFHHLIPKKVHRRQRFRKNFSKEQLSEGIDVCQLCHRGIHKLYDEMTLARTLNTKQKLIEDENIQKHIAWVKKQKRGLRT